MIKDPCKRPSASELLEHEWFTHEPKVSPLISKKYLQSLRKFESGNTFSHALMTFIITNIAHLDANDDALKLFKELDTNGDGLLTEDELVAGYERLYPMKEKDVIEKEVKDIIG